MALSKTRCHSSNAPDEPEEYTHLSHVHLLSSDRDEFYPRTTGLAIGQARLPGSIALDIVSDLIRVFDCVDVMANLSSHFGLTPLTELALRSTPGVAGPKTGAERLLG